MAVDIKKLFNGGFNTGHGFLREPNSIQCASALACIAIQSNQNDQHGGQSIPSFDYGLADGVRKTFARRYWDNLVKASEFSTDNQEGLADKVKLVVHHRCFFPPKFWVISAASARFRHPHR